MLEKIWTFVKRHKKKFIFTGVLIGGGFYLKSYVESKLKEWQEQQLNEYVEQMRKQQHFESTQKTCNSTVLSFVKNLREHLIRCMNSEMLTMELKSNPENKIEIWEELKVVAFGRAITIVYALSMLVVLLRVKLTILGGYMYKEMLGKSNLAPAIGVQLQEHYLGNVQHLLGPGLENLSKIILGNVEEVMSNTPLKQNFSLRDLENVCARIRHSTESKESGDCIALEVSKFCMPLEDSSQGFLSSTDSEKFNLLMDETRDILENADCQVVFKNMLDIGFSELLDAFAEFFSNSLQTDISVALRSSTEVLIPLAKLIPVASSMVHTICADEISPLMMQILKNESLTSWSANIYEAFVNQDKGR